MPDSFATPWTVARQALRGIFQGRILKWDTMSFSRGSSWPWTDISCISCLAGRLFITKPPGKPCWHALWRREHQLAGGHYAHSLATPWPPAPELSRSGTRRRRLYHPVCHVRDGSCRSKHSQDTVGVRLWFRPTSWLRSPRLCSRGSVAHLQSCSHLPFPMVLSWLMSTHVCNAVTLFINGVHILLSTLQSPTIRGKGNFKRPCPRISFHCSGNQSPKSQFLPQNWDSSHSLFWFSNPSFSPLHPPDLTFVIVDKLFS